MQEALIMAHVNLIIRDIKTDMVSSFVTRPVLLSSVSTSMHDCSIIANTN